MNKKIQLMLVDDSAIVRGLMQRALSSDPAIEIAATATDGQMALDTLKRKPVDIIILDIEMPGMDGLTALPLLIQASPKTKIIMSSTLTLRNAEISLRALALGASDYLAKPEAREPGAADEFYRQMMLKIHALAPAGSAVPQAVVNLTPVLNPAFVPKVTAKPPLATIKAGALAIACSTGGPQALLDIFKKMSGQRLRVPIFITQHMPPNFTTILAQHIKNASGHECHEATDGDEVKPGVIYIAPGDYHMTVVRDGMAVKLRLDKNPQENFCRPSADPMLRSLAKVYGNALLTFVLTGLGADGAKGAAEVVGAGGMVVAQSEASCVVYGMPKAVVDAKLASLVLPLNEIGPYMVAAVA